MAYLNIEIIVPSHRCQPVQDTREKYVKSTKMTVWTFNVVIMAHALMVWIRILVSVILGILELFAIKIIQVKC